MPSSHFRALILSPAQATPSRLAWFSRLSIFRGLSVALILSGALLANSEADTLKSQLDARRAEFLKAAPPEKVASYQEGIDTVAASGIYEKAAKPGSKAPDFTLNNAKGEPTQLSKLLENGPVILTWYRGGWCPYCNLALTALTEKMPEITAAGGQLVALTPELPEYAEDTVEKNQVPFEVLSDLQNNVAREYGIVFKMTPGVAAAMQKGAQIHERNGDSSDELPLSATYVIDQDGNITYAFLDADYRNRAEPDVLIEELEKLKSTPAKEN